MTSIRHIASFCVLFLALSLAACDLSETITQDAPPQVDDPLECTAAPPDSAQATVTAEDCIAESGQFACTASYAVPREGTERALWSFPGATPSDPSDTSGTVIYRFTGTLPRTFNWSVSRCSCSRAADMNGDSCIAGSGTVTFTG